MQKDKNDICCHVDKVISSNRTVQSYIYMIFNVTNPSDFQNLMGLNVFLQLKLLP